MIFCTTANPNPVPLFLVVKNGRNNFGMASCAIPGPLSLTAIRCHPASSLSITSPRNVTRPPPSASAHASAAFLARFSSACRSSPSSPATSPKFPPHSIVTCGIVCATSSTARCTTSSSSTRSSGISSGRAYFRNSATICVMFLVCCTIFLA